MSFDIACLHTDIHVSTLNSSVSCHQKLCLWSRDWGAMVAMREAGLRGDARGNLLWIHVDLLFISQANLISKMLLIIMDNTDLGKLCG